MTKIEYFISFRSEKNPNWKEVYDLCAERGITINREVKDCDVSVVFGGKLENPLPLKGKKVLALKKNEWLMMKWDLVYSDILEEYYDHMIDTTNLTPTDTLRMIEKKCRDL